MKLFAFVALVSLISFTQPLFAEALSPRAQVQKTIEEVLNVVKALPGDANAAQRRIKMREVINPHFDFEEMSRRSLGAAWAERTQGEQREFVSLFSDLLAKTYLARIENIKDDTVAIEREDLNFPKAAVKTIITYKGDKFPIEYKMYSASGLWRIYDVVIENIGLVANYRNEFAQIIRKDDFSGLLAKLREKNAAAS